MLCGCCATSATAELTLPDPSRGPKSSMAEELVLPGAALPVSRPADCIEQRQDGDQPESRTVLVFRAHDFRVMQCSSSLKKFIGVSLKGADLRNLLHDDRVIKCVQRTLNELIHSSDSFVQREIEDVVIIINTSPAEEAPVSTLVKATWTLTFATTMNDNDVEVAMRHIQKGKPS
eukprot:TRINITY_DN30577_c0_g1_i1.p1 TRINITY_DN30577_c0_g1~~TRINITY_DN30577_c0_g1_i1.p1  ORF type:complete len:175 (+),score=21.64 TRINITY_DN30577_c0_g1_i1:173-697(+)